MMYCSPRPHPTLTPSPCVLDLEAARWVQLSLCQIELITTMIGESMGQLLTGKLSAEDKFPLSSADCLRLIECITAQLPVLSPQSCCTELDLRMPQSQLWQLAQWREWVELFYAEAIIRHGDKPGSEVLSALITRNYTVLTTIRRKLASTSAYSQPLPP